MRIVDKAFLLSHPKYHKDNFNFIIKTFLDNDYSINFIFVTINLRLRSLLKRLKQTKKTNIDYKTTSFPPSLFCLVFTNLRALSKNHQMLNCLSSV